MIERKFIDASIKKLKATEYINRAFAKAGVSEVSIQRTTLATRIGVRVERPGFIIGRKGKTIKDLSASMEKILGIENPQIEVNDVTNPNLDPSVIARWVVSMLERGLKPKRVVHKAIDRIMSAKAIGAEIELNGKIHGKGAKARKERVLAGYLKKAGDSTKLIRTAHENAVLKQGIIGVLVKIAPPDVVFPDKVDIGHLLKPPAAVKTEPAGEAAPQKGAEEAAKPAPVEEKAAGEKEETGKEEKTQEPEKGESGDTEKKRAAGPAKRRAKRKTAATKE